jgi:hypothetical protein
MATKSSQFAKRKRSSVIGFFSRKFSKDNVRHIDSGNGSASDTIGGGPLTAEPNSETALADPELPPYTSHSNYAPTSLSTSVNVEEQGKKPLQRAEALQPNDKLPPTVHILLAEERVKAAAEKLKKKIPQEIFQTEALEIKPIHGCADINSLSQLIESAIGTLMEQQQFENSEQTMIQALTNAWVKKVIPFVQQGLSIVKVQIRINLG